MNTTLSGKAKLAGVMGWPIGHSLSPRLHGYWLRRYAVDGAYVPLAVRREDFAEAVRVLPHLGSAGPAVTLAHQEAALAGALAIEGTATTFLAADTDGIDGATDAAGDVVDAGTIGKGRAVGLDAIDALADNDAHGYLTATDDLLITGPTGTNVADLWLVHPRR